MKPLLGSLAALVVIFGTLPYIIDTIKGSTKPSRATWTLLTLLIVLDLLVQHDIGVGWALALTIGEVIATGSVFVLSIWRGIGGMEKVELVCYVLWGAMVACWLLLDRPLLALHFGVAADLISLIPTFIKSWQSPHEETKSVFVTSAIAGLLGAAAVASYSYDNLLLPVYLFLANSAVALTIWIAESRHRKKSSVKETVYRV